MSAIHSINILLDSEYNKANVKSLLQKGAEVGFLYQADPLETLEKPSKILNIDNATKRSMQGKFTMDNFGAPFVCIKYLDTEFNFTIYQSKNNLMDIHISGFCWKWIKEFDDDELHIDYARYARLIIDMSDDITVLKLDIETLD